MEQEIEEYKEPIKKGYWDKQVKRNKIEQK